MGKDKGYFGEIYIISNDVNEKLYVGQTTKSLELRFKQHFYADSAIGKAMRKYGIEHFQIRTIEKCYSREQQNAFEIFWIRELGTLAPNGYNLTIGGEGTKGHSPSLETRMKKSIANKGKKIPKEQRIKISESLVKYYQTHPEAHVRLSQSAKNISEESRLKRSMAQLGKKHSLEHRQKISASLMGNTRRRGKPFSKSARQKMSQAHKGKKFTDAHRAKISAALKAYWARKRAQENAQRGD